MRIDRNPPPVRTAEDLLLDFERTGDAQPFEEVVRRYSGMVYGVCYRVTRNAHDAEDAAQAVFLKLASQVRTTGGVPRVGPWLQQVAKTTAVDLRRSRARRQTREQVRAALVDQQQSYADATETASMDELKQILRDEVDRLPVHYRTPLVLYYFGGLSTEQIAVELGSNAKALAVRLFRGRKMLGSRLEAKGIVAAGGAVATLAVADAILAAMANSVFHAPSATVAGSGMSASAGWTTSHSAVAAGIASRVSSVARSCAIATVAGKWKLSVILLLTMGSAMAGSSESVRNSAVVNGVGSLLQQAADAVRGLGRVRGLFRQDLPSLRAQVETPATPDGGRPLHVATSGGPAMHGPVTGLTAPLNPGTKAGVSRSPAPVARVGYGRGEAGGTWRTTSGITSAGNSHSNDGPVARRAAPGAGSLLLAMAGPLSAPPANDRLGSAEAAVSSKGGSTSTAVESGPIAITATGGSPAAAWTDSPTALYAAKTPESPVADASLAVASAAYDDRSGLFAPAGSGPSTVPMPGDMGFGFVDPTAATGPAGVGGPAATATSPGGVPEPGSLGLAIAAAAGLLLRRRSPRVR